MSGESIALRMDAAEDTLGVAMSVALSAAALPMEAAGGGIRLGTLDANANGAYAAEEGTAWERVNVAVPARSPVLQNKTVTANGTVTADAGYDGLGAVTVAVPAGSAGTGKTRQIVERTAAFSMLAEDFGGATSIGSGAFRSCTGLASVVIPDSVTSIGTYAFYGCTGLLIVVVPDSVTSIGGDAFNGCNSLVNATVGEGVTSIGNNAFRSCTGLASFTIPNSVTSIGTYAFYGCTGLTSITIPDGVTSIGQNAFSGCTGLTSVVIGDSVTSIGISTFSGCTGLTSVVIPDSVTSIETNAFSGCTGLTSAVIGDGVTTIWINAFRGCSNLESLVIGSGITTIGPTTSAASYQPFYGCTSLKSLTIHATTPPTLNNANALSGVPEDCAIYVPAESVDAYKAASRWSARAAYIQAIP